MATSSFALSSYMSVRAPIVAQRSRLVGLPSVRSLPRRTVVRCQNEQPLEQPTASTPPSPAPKPKPKVSTKFSDMLAFSGPAPERINGRLAMLGFFAAIAAEAASGEDLFVQLSNGGFSWFIGTAVLFSVASLVPLFKGENVQSKTTGIMNENAEMWNGRFAMLGLVALAFTEYLKGGPLV
ncbi:early light-induced protein, chloroplastic-like isoform X2 [Carex rostrata]